MSEVISHLQLIENELIRLHALLLDVSKSNILADRVLKLIENHNKSLLKPIIYWPQSGEDKK